MPLLVKMPKWGMLMKAGTVTAWLRAEGDAVAAGDPLFTVETDKAINDVEAPAEGVLRRIVADTGSEVLVAGPVAVIAGPGETLSDADVDAFVAANTAATAATAGTGGAARVARAPRPAERDAAGRVTASPAARKRARELGIDLTTVTATGAGGRVTSDDVERAAGGADGPEPREERIELAGDRIYVLAAGPAGAPPVVLLHGIGGSAATWQGVLEPLAIDHRVVAVDFPAHGQSDVPDRDLTVAGLAATVVELLAALGLERATLVGHSLGGAVAIEAALRAPTGSRGWCWSTAPGSGRTSAAARAAARRAARDGQLAGAPAAVLRGPAARAGRRCRRAPRRDGTARRPRGGADAPAGRVHRRGRPGIARRSAGGARQPVLVVWGDRDRVFPVAHAERAQAVLPGAELRLVAGAGHVPQVEDPAVFAEILTDFLERTGT